MRHWMFAFALLLFAAPRGHAQTFNVGANFQSMQSSESQFQPPDTQGSAGQNQLMILNNGRVKIFNKIGTQQQTMDEYTFFGNAGYPSAGGAGNQSAYGDGRIRFDPLTGRWYVLNFTSGVDTNLTNNKLVLAVSAGADATSVANGNWKSVVITPNQTGYLSDQPTMGIDKNGVYINTNNYQNIGGNGFNESLYTLNKNSLLWSGAGSPTLNMTRHESLDWTNYGFGSQPATNFDPNQSGTTNRAVSLSAFSNEAFRTYTINNTGGTTTLGTPTVVSGATLQSAPPRAPQLGSSVTIDTGDPRIASQAVQVGGFIYFANTWSDGSVGARSQIRWTILNAANGALVSQGNISDPSLYFYHPSLSVNEDGQAVIAFSGSNSSTFVNAYAAVSTGALGSLSFGAVTQIVAGQSAWTGSRFGDYSQTNVDPADTGVFWAFQEYAGPSNQYATRATEIIPNIAGQTRWLQASSGNYASGASWFSGAVPAAGDHVIYSRNGSAFTVTLPAGATNNDRISVRQGNVTFSIPSGATYAATDALATSPSFAVSQMLGDSTVTITGGGTFNTVYTTLAAGENGLGDANNISKATVNVTGAGTTWNNSRDVFFGGSSTRSGGTAALTLSGGSAVTIGQTATFWNSGSSITLTGATPVTLSVGGLNSAVGVTPTITGTGTASLNITDGLGQTFFGTISGTTALTKTGTGTQTLAGSLTYTGATNINGGRLNIDGTKSGAGAVNVNNGGVLGGTGSVAGAVTVNSGGTIAPGHSPGVLTFSSGLTMNAGTYEWELAALSTTGPGTNFDEMVLTGGIASLGGTSQVTLAFPTAGVNPNTPNPFWLSDHQWTIFDANGGTILGNFSGISNPQYGFGNFTLGFVGGDVMLNFHFAPVPEPGAMALSGAALAAFFVWRRRRAA